MLIPTCAIGIINENFRSHYSVLGILVSNYVGKKIVKLTQAQLQMIREATIDESAFQRIVALFEHQAADPEPIQASSIFNLDEQQTKLLSALLDAIPVAVYIKDTQSRFVMVNQHALTIMNGMNEDVRGKTDFDMLSRDVAQYYFDLEQQIITTGTPILNQEVNFYDQDENPVWVLMSKDVIRDEHGEIIGLIGINLDITPQKLAEQSLEHEHNLLRTVVDHIQDKIYVKDRQGRFVMANTATLKGHRTTADKHMGTTDFDYMNPERAQHMWEEEQAIMESGVPVINQELYTPRDSLNKLVDDLWFLVSKVPLIDKNGEVTGLVGINRNITSRKVAEQKASELKLEQERSQILSNFMTHSSHEFRTPLSVIQTATYLLNNADHLDKIYPYVEQIKQQTRRMNHLIDELQLMLRLDNLTHIEVRPIYLDSIIRTILNQAEQRILEKHLTVHLVENSTDVIVKGEREMLGIALSSILDNAIRYTQDEGTITICYEIEDARICITIQDNGIGMSNETLAHLYERFFRADEAHTTLGFGLGLSITKRIIELHGGDIQIDSQIGVGSEVRLILPIDESSQVDIP
jgi:PAS domain S-box-containing protein